MKIVVIGAGSVGAHVAFRLTQQGADVIVIDASTPGSGTSASSIAWLSTFPQMSWTEEPGRAALRPLVHDTFRRLQEEVPGDYVRWSGTLLWGNEDETDDLIRSAGIARERGVELDILSTAEARELEPGVHVPEGRPVFSEPGSGWVDGPAVVRALLAESVKRGATLLTDVRVVGFRQAGENLLGAVLLSDGQSIEADAFVNAAGSWGSHIAAMADLAIPLDLVPGRLVYSEAVPGLPTHVVNGPEWCARPDPSGGLAIHWRGGPQEPGHGSNVRSAQDVIDAIAPTIALLSGTVPARSSIGIRPIPPGGPIVGALPWLPNLYFTLSHGGIGWGPMWGWMASREILGGERVPELAGMRPERFYLAPIDLGRYADDAEQIG